MNNNPESTITILKSNSIKVVVTSEQLSQLKKGFQVRGYNPDDPSDYIFIMPHVESWEVYED